MGNIGLVSLSRLKDIPADRFQSKLLIVREPGQVDYRKYGLIHAPHLSPSRTLFDTYHRRWKKNDFTIEEYQELQGTPNATWWHLYVPRFISEMRVRPDMIRALERVEELLQQGTNVLFICFCKEETNCHRGILGQYFEDKGYNIEHY